MSGMRQRYAPFVYDCIHAQGCVWVIIRREVPRCPFYIGGQCEGLDWWNGQQIQVLALLFYHIVPLPEDQTGVENAENPYQRVGT